MIFLAFECDHAHQRYANCAMSTRTTNKKTEKTKEGKTKLHIAQSCQCAPFERSSIAAKHRYRRSEHCRFRIFNGMQTFAHTSTHQRFSGDSTNELTHRHADRQKEIQSDRWAHTEAHDAFNLSRDNEQNENCIQLPFEFDRR